MTPFPRNLVRLAILGAALTCALTPLKGFAWGSVGHTMVAETAALVLEREMPKTWGPLLGRHRVEMGFYSTLPDSTFRYNDGPKKLDRPTHYFDVDVAFQLEPNSPALAKAKQDFPRGYADAKKFLKAKKIDVDTVGSALWRAEQFQYLSWKQFKTVKKPEGAYVQGKAVNGETRAVFNGLFYLGLLAHYTADVTMPLHSTIDWNAYKSGQGGIHFYYENECVDSLEPGLSGDVLELALSKKESWLKKWNAENDTLAGVVLSVITESYEILPSVLELDREKFILQIAKPLEHHDAKRKPAKEACPALKSHLVEQLAKASVLTAHAWKQVLPTQVDMSKAQTLRFADLEQDIKFVAPAYEFPAEYYQTMKKVQ
ncbi:hypothetical protein K2X30_13545 [bacterium]|jgi:hypothetical protein|nr:hypothetical protein [bacterium]